MDPLNFEDVFPIENGDIPVSYVSLPEGISSKLDHPGGPKSEKIKEHGQVSAFDEEDEVRR